MNKLIKLGICSKLHGLKGEVVLDLDNPHNSILCNNFKIIGHKDSSSFQLTIESVKFGNKVICQFKEFENIEIAQSYLPFEIQVNRSDFPKLNDSEFYFCDLIGLNVQDHSGQVVGQINSFYNNGAGEIAVIKKTSGLIELPFVSVFFPIVDIENKKIIINFPEYL